MNWKELAKKAHEYRQAEQEAERRERDAERRQEMIDAASDLMMSVGLSRDDMSGATFEADNTEYSIYFTLDGVRFAFYPRQWHSSSSEADNVRLVSNPCPCCGAQRISQFPLYRSATLADLGRMLTEPPQLATIHEVPDADDGVRCNGTVKLYPMENE